MTPYAQGKRWTLWHADCLDVLAAGLIPADAAIVSDVPYGMGWDVDSTRFSGFGPSVAAGRRQPPRPDDGRDDHEIVTGDAEPFDPSPWLGFPAVVLSGANHFAQRLPVGTILVWVKRAPHLYGSFLSDAEIAWMKGGHGVYCHEEQFPSPARARETHGDTMHPTTLHPTQKPIRLCRWWIERAKVSAGGLVVDPYAGLATTGVAALSMGRSFIGCEIEPAYLDIAARRLAQAESDGVQGTLFGAP